MVLYWLLNIMHYAVCSIDENNFIRCYYSFSYHKLHSKINKQAQRRAAMDRRMHCIIPNESYNINHNITIRLTKTIAVQSDDALSYYTVRGLYFPAVVFVRSI